jgi:leader peptidase (prepilin peptidase)/N-methyltransferase
VTWSLDAAAAVGAVCLASGFLVPTIIRRVPEPPTKESEVDEADTTTPEDPTDLSTIRSPDTVAEEPKELYVSIAALPGLGWKSALAAGVVGALVGGKVGWHWELLFLVYLVPLGVALAVVDWRTRLLPTRLIAPSYAVVITLVVAAAVLSGDRDDLVRAGWGWFAYGVLFFATWWIYPPAMGYGDVRLSGLLGIALGYLGWGELVVGIFGAFLVGGPGGLVLSMLKIVDRKANPFGPAMLIGAVLGVLLGPWYAGHYVA